MTARRPVHHWRPAVTTPAAPERCRASGRSWRSRCSAASPPPVCGGRPTECAPPRSGCAVRASRATRRREIARGQTRRNVLSVAIDWGSTAAERSASYPRRRLSSRPAFSLCGGRLSSPRRRSCVVGVGGVAHFSFGAWGADCSWELSRLLNSMRGRQAARKQRELAGTGVVPRGRLGLKGSLRERTCQVAIRTLRATADLAGFLPWRAASWV
jgi:hypothetical protein